MNKQTTTILFIADIVGKPGADIVKALLPGLKKNYQVDLCIANGENVDNGKGITESQARQLFTMGIDIITGGNHSWNNAQFRNYLDTSTQALRPHNYPREAPGRGVVLVKTTSGTTVGVLNLQGRTFMYPIECPFKTASQEVERLGKQTSIIIVDFHAEATAEKMALAWYLDGKVSAIIGTHTHVQTADERILPMGTAYITDVGMTGPHDSVIGMECRVAIKRFIRQIPEKYRIASSNTRLCGIVIVADNNTGRALKVTRLNLP